MNCLTEFDVESAIKTWREDGYEDGYDEGRADGKQEKAMEDAITLIKKYNASPEDAAIDMGVSLDKVLEALK